MQNTESQRRFNLIAILAGCLIVAAGFLLFKHHDKPISGLTSANFTSRYSPGTDAVLPNYSGETNGNIDAVKQSFIVFNQSSLSIPSAVGDNLTSLLSTALAREVSPSQGITYIQIASNTLHCTTIYDCSFSFYIGSPESYFAYHLFYADNGTQEYTLHRLPLPNSYRDITSGALQNASIIANVPSADQLVPLGSGYLYISKLSRSLDYIDTSGKVTPMDGQLGLTTTPIDSSDPLYDTVFAIQSVSTSEAIVSTTLGAFIVRGPNDVTPLPLSLNVNFNASAYDEATNRLYLLASDSETVYSYNLSQPDQNPSQVFSVTKAVNRISAGGGKVVVYYDNVPSTEAAVVAVYDQKHQLDPVVFDTHSKKLQILSGLGVTAIFTISPDGKFAAIKQNSATTMQVRNLTTNKSVSVTPPDAGAIAWQDDMLYIGQGSSVLLYNANSANKTVTSYMNTGTTISYLYIGRDTKLAETTSDKLLDLGSAVSSASKTTQSTPTIAVSQPIYWYYSPGGEQ